MNTYGSAAGTPPTTVVIAILFFTPPTFVARLALLIVLLVHYSLQPNTFRTTLFIALLAGPSLFFILSSFDFTLLLCFLSLLLSLPDLLLLLNLYILEPRPFTFSSFCVNNPFEIVLCLATPLFFCRSHFSPDSLAPYSPQCMLYRLKVVRDDRVHSTLYVFVDIAPINRTLYQCRRLSSFARQQRWIPVDFSLCFFYQCICKASFRFLYISQLDRLYRQLVNNTYTLFEISPYTFAHAIKTTAFLE